MSEILGKFATLGYCAVSILFGAIILVNSTTFSKLSKPMKVLLLAILLSLYLTAGIKYSFVIASVAIIAIPWFISMFALLIGIAITMPLVFIVTMFLAIAYR